VSTQTRAGGRGSAGEDHQRALVRLIEDAAHHRRRLEVFSDFVELSSLAFSNAVDRRQHEARELAYKTVAAKYAAADFEQFPRMLGHLTLAMERRCALGELGDVLGAVYMQLGLGNECAGQFFTPYEVSRAVGAMLVGDGAQAREKGFLDVMEPACGAGGMVIAIAEALMRAGLNYQGAMHATCIDVDARCAHMTYVQASLLHIPAVVLHGNSLSNEIWSRWYTPAHVLGGWRRRLAERCGGESGMATTAASDGAVELEASALDRFERVPPELQQLRLFDD